MTGRGFAVERIPTTHVEWQQQVIEAAHYLGWSHLHVRRSIGKGHRWVTATNRDGWPDLFLWHPTRGFAAIELKVGGDRATLEQLAVLDELEAAGAKVMVAYPENLDVVVTLLGGTGHTPR